MIMNCSRVVWVAVAALCVAGMSTSEAQQAAATTATMKPVVPLRVVVTMSRFQGEKKTASVPFEFIVNANEFMSPTPPTNPIDMSRYSRATQVRIGVNVPAGVETSTSQAGVTTSRPSYRYVGTNIDCSAMSEDDGRFRIYVSIDDSSIFTADPSSPGVLRVGEPAAFRTLSTSNRVTLKDGQTALLATATDRLSADVVKVEVTATVMK